MRRLFNLFPFSSNVDYLDDDKHFQKVDWGEFGFMHKKEIEGQELGCRGKSFAQLRDMAVSNCEVVAFLHNPREQTAIFLTHLEGEITSPKSKSWPAFARFDTSNHQALPVYIRKSLLDRSWKVGSKVNLSTTKPAQKGIVHNVN